MSLKPIFLMVNQIEKAILRKQKLELLEKFQEHPLFKQVLKFTYDPEIKIGIKRINIHEKKKRGTVLLFEWLNYLNQKTEKITSEEIEKLEMLSSDDEETIELVNRILNKNLKIGLSSDKIIEYMKNNNIK